MKLFRKLCAIPAHERRLLLIALPVVVITRLGLWICPLPLLQGLLCRLADLTAGPSVHQDYANRAACAVRRASRLVPQASCLTQALATIMLLRRRGLIGRLRIGVQRDPEGQFRAHAWVELCGRVVIGGSPDGLTEFTPLPLPHEPA